jgi:hypothetical protein
MRWILLSLLAVPSFAQDFPSVHVKFKSGQKAAEGQPAVHKSAAQSGADLYYFTPEEAQEAAKKFGDFKKLDKGFTYDKNVPAEIKAQMNADLAFIKGISGSGATPLHREIFGAVDGKGYYDWFDSRVTAIGMNGCGSAKAVACVIPFMNPSKMWLTQNFVKFSHPQISRMMVVYHEARHTETDNGNWAHATCPDPFKDENGNDMKSIWTGATLAGEPACDVTPRGSYGSSTIMLKNIQKFCSNCTDKVKMDAGLYADDQFGRIIDDGARAQMKDDLYK